MPMTFANRKPGEALNSIMDQISKSLPGVWSGSRVHLVCWRELVRAGEKPKTPSISIKLAQKWLSGNNFNFVLEAWKSGKPLISLTETSGAPYRS
jgi:hypothetical protein